MPARTPRPKGKPAYVRAALAYADISQETAGNHLGVSASTINRWATSAPPGEEMLVRLAALCGVPFEFFEHGFWGEEPPGGDRQRVRRLERQLAALSDRLAALEAGRQQTITREQAEEILSELLDPPPGTPGQQPGPGRDHQGEAC